MGFSLCNLRLVYDLHIVFVINVEGYSITT